MTRPRIINGIVSPQIPAGHILLLLSMLSLFMLTGCEQEKQSDNEKEGESDGPEEVQLTTDNAVDIFVHKEIEAMFDVHIQEQLDKGATNIARQYCDVTKARMEFMKEQGHPDAVDGLDERYEEVCKTRVSLVILDDFIKDVESAADGQERSTRCETGAFVMAFIYEHKALSDEVRERRNRAFELCPALKAQWEAVESGKMPDPMNMPGPGGAMPGGPGGPGGAMPPGPGGPGKSPDGNSPDGNSPDGNSPDGNSPDGDSEGQ